MVLGWPAMGTDQPLSAAETRRFRQVVSVHVERYPAMEVQDLYKLLFQAAMGSEHAVRDRQVAREWLEREVANLAPREEDRIIESLPPDNGLVRVHLRPYIERGGDLEELLDAFLETATRYPPSTQRLEMYWSLVESMAESGDLPFARQQLAAYIATQRERGLPPVRHSAVYRDLYRPAYRVVLLDVEAVE
jgi:hypothetical protein